MDRLLQITHTKQLPPRDDVLVKVPSTITTSNLTTTFTYADSLAVTGATRNDGISTSIVYDANARPSSGASPDGATTTYAYSAAGTTPIWTKATTYGK